jgi:hypothetical protein
MIQSAAELARRPAVRIALLIAMWLTMMAISYLVFVRPYALTTYLSTPKLSTGVIAGRRAGPAASFIFGFIGLFALYAGAYRLCRGWRSTTAAAIVAAGGLLLALLLAAVYPIGANDLFGYITAGELLAFHGVNPMVHPPTYVPNLPFAEYSAYYQVLPNYGPVWTWIEGAVAAIAGKPDLTRLALGFKAVAILGYALACAVLILLLPRRAPDKVLAGLVVLAWNPLVLFEVGANGHNDIWIGLLLLVAVLLWEQRHRVGVLVALTLAALIKVPVSALLPLFAIAGWRLEPDGRHRLRFAVAGAGAVMAVVAASYLLLPEGIKGVANLWSRTDLFTHSLPAVLRLGIGLAMPLETATVLVGTATALAFGAYVLWQMRNAWQTPGEAVRLGFNVLLFLLLVCMTWFQPWYLLWLICLAAAYPRDNAPFQAGLFALCASWSYVVFGFVWFWLSSFASWGHALGIELLAMINTFALSWEYAILSGMRREGVSGRPTADPSSSGLT